MAPGEKSSGIVLIRASGARIPAPPGALGSHSPLGAKFRTRSVRGVPENRLQMSAPPHVELMPLFFFSSAFDDMLLALRRRLRLRAGHTATGVGRTPPGGEKWAAAAHLVHSAPACQSALCAAVPFPLWPRRSPLPPLRWVAHGRKRKKTTDGGEREEGALPFSLSLCPLLLLPLLSPPLRIRATVGRTGGRRKRNR